MRELLKRRARAVAKAPPAPGTSWHEPPTENREVVGFGERIREIRLAQAMSQKAVCRRARPLLSPAGLHRIEEGGRKDPRLATLWALAAALNLRVTIRAEGVEVEWLEGRPSD